MIYPLLRQLSSRHGMSLSLKGCSSWALPSYIHFCWQPPATATNSWCQWAQIECNWQSAHAMVPALSRCFFPYSNWWTTWQPVIVFDGQLERHFPQVTYITLLEKLLSCIISFTKCWLLKDVFLSATCPGSLLGWVPPLCKIGCTAIHWPFVYCLIFQNKWWPNNFSSFFVGAFAKTCSLLPLGGGHYGAIWHMLGRCGVTQLLLIPIRTNNIEGFPWEMQ